MTDTSKALELADDYARKCVLRGGIFYGTERAALANELRRQHAEIAELKAELERIRSRGLWQMRLQNHPLLEGREWQNTSEYHAKWWKKLNPDLEIRPLPKGLT